jgi:hypothetical protein
VYGPPGEASGSHGRYDAASAVPWALPQGKHWDEPHTVGEVFGLDQGLATIPAHTFTFDFEWAKNRITELDRIEY